MRPGRKAIYTAEEREERKKVYAQNAKLRRRRVKAEWLARRNMEKTLGVHETRRVKSRNEARRVPEVVGIPPTGDVLLAEGCGVAEVAEDTRMNGIGGGGREYMSEDDFEDFKPAILPPTAFSHFSGPPASAPAAAGGAGPSSALNFSSSAAPGSSSSRNQICCLLDDGKRCTRTAGNASYSKRIQKTVFYKKLKLENDLNANHIYICDYHKMVIQNARSRQKKESDDENDGEEFPEPDLYHLQVNTLRRYKKHFKVSSRPGLNKAQLADVLTRHFKTIPVAEKETVTYFIYMIKTDKNKLDNPTRAEPGGGGGGSSEFPDRYN